MGQDCSDCARLQVERASALKATHDLEKVLLREGDVEGSYERRLAEAVRERNEALAEASRLDDEAIYQRGLYESARAEVERLQRELTESEVAREALRKQRDEARTSDAESLRLYRNVRERLDKVQEERDFAVSALRQAKSPAESCAEERAAGNGGCGACALCCKELGAELDVVRKDRAELRLQSVTLREALKGYYHECLCNRDEIRAANKRAYSALQMTDHLP